MSPQQKAPATAGAINRGELGGLPDTKIRAWQIQGGNACIAPLQYIPGKIEAEAQSFNRAVAAQWGWAETKEGADL